MEVDECTPWLLGGGGGGSDTSNSADGGRNLSAAVTDGWTDPVMKGHWLLDTDANTDEDNDDNDDNSKSIHEDTPAPTPPIDTQTA